MKRTNRILIKMLSLLMAFALQVMPLIRSALASLNESFAPSSWAVVFRWVAGGAAIVGFDAISKASSIAISPPNATVGQPYVGTITYSGGHAGSVSSMSISNFCLSASTNLFDSLTIVYSGGNTAAVSGTPTNAGTFAFTLKIFDGGCFSGNSDTRSTSLVVGSGGGGGVAPVITSPPQGVTAQIGADALLSAGASGNPAPTYFWYRGIPNIATNLVGIGPSLDFAAAQFTNAGLYTVVASNASGSASAPAYLSVCSTPGTNQLALNYTNYASSAQALTMFSYLTNVTTGSNVYKWQYNSVDITAYSQSGNYLNLTSAQVTPAKSGQYSVVFNSVVGASTVVNQQLYYSFWAFGQPPTINVAPQGTNVAIGTDIILSATATNNAVPASTPQLPYYGTNTPLTFLWFLNSSNLVATQVTNGLIASDNLTIRSVSAANAGDYTVVVSNYWGSVTSAPATLSLTSSGTAPGIVTQPSPASVLVGQNTAYRVIVSGTDPLSYQWMLGNTALSNNNIYSGVNTNTLTLTGVTLTNAGSYSVVITNPFGSTNSVGVPLVVQPPPPVNIARGPNGLELTGNTITGLTYVVLASSNLTTGWVPVATNTVSGDGSLSFTNPMTGLNQFLRLQFP